jgi:hydroxymethylpyrimidine/phosphomethylpyrimidine kinase
MAPAKATQSCWSTARSEPAAVCDHADGRPIGSLEDMKEAAVALHALGPQWVLVKVIADKSHLLPG